MSRLSELRTDAKAVYQLTGVDLYDLAKKYGVSTRNTRYYDAYGHTPGFALLASKGDIREIRSLLYSTIKREIAKLEGS